MLFIQDFQILVEADFLVNIDEDQMSKEAIQSIKEKIFKTRTGINYINHLYLWSSKSIILGLSQTDSFIIETFRVNNPYNK